MAVPRFWIDGAAFARRAIEMSLQDRQQVASLGGRSFFDRGLIDAAAALEHLTGEPVLAALGQAHRYHSRVFLTPPWPEIYGTDEDRRHDLVDAIAEYERLCHAYDSLGYEMVILPKVSVADRADLVLGSLAIPDHQPHGPVQSGEER